MSDKFDDAPNIDSYYALWGKHEFDMDAQRNILLWFLADTKLDKKFMAYINYYFPQDEDGVRQPRAELERKHKRLLKTLHGAKHAQS